MEDSTRASLRERAYASTKPVKKAEIKLTTNATFSDIPCCTRSVKSQVKQVTRLIEETHVYLFEFVWRPLQLQPCRNRQCLDKGLPGDGIDLASVDPDKHVEVGADEHTN